MAVKIRLKRLGKVRVPQYRIVVVDSRKKRDGRVLEEIGKYHPKEDPSYISVVSDRAQYWLGVGAQPSDAVAAILKITGDWQKFKGLPGAGGHPPGRHAQARQDRRLQRGAQGGPRRGQGRGRDQEGRRQEGRQGRGGRGQGRREARRGEAERDRGRGAPAEVPASETPEGAAAEAETAEAAEVDAEKKSEDA